jgi:hypothetical protein
MNAGLVAADIALVSGDERKVAWIKTHAQALIAMGAGKIVGGVDDRAFCKIVLVDSTGATIPGTYRFAYTNHAGTRVSVVCDKRSEDLATGTTVRLGENPMKSKEDSFINVYFTADADATIDFSHTSNVISFPTTTYE